MHPYLDLLFAFPASPERIRLLTLQLRFRIVLLVLQAHLQIRLELLLLKFANLVLQAAIILQDQAAFFVARAIIQQ